MRPTADRPAFDREGPYAHGEPGEGSYRGTAAQGWRGWGLRDGYAGSDVNPRPGEGPHSGKGPRTVRSDERLREEVCERLTESARVDAREIEVKVETGEVTLDGVVDARDGKRRAEAIAERVHGVVHVQNNLRTREQAAAAAGRIYRGRTRDVDAAEG